MNVEELQGYFPEYKSRVDAVNAERWVTVRKSRKLQDRFFFIDAEECGVANLEVLRTCKDIAGKFMVVMRDSPQRRGLWKDFFLTETVSKEFLVCTNYEPTLPEESGEAVTCHMEFTQKDMELGIVGGIVYKANVADGQGDWADEETVCDAMYYFMEKGREYSTDHAEWTEASVLECFQAEEDTTKGGGPVPKGAWYMTVKLHDPVAKQRVKDGQLNGFSWEGRVLRERDVPVGS